MKQHLSKIISGIEFHDIIGLLGLGFLFLGLRDHFSLAVAEIAVGAVFLVLALMGAYTNRPD